MVVEVKALLRASLPDVGHHLNQQGGVHLGLDQQPAAAPHRRHWQNKKRIGWSPLGMEVVCYFSFTRRLYDMNKNVFVFFSCLLDDGGLLLCNVEPISIPHRYTLP
uniref:Uncharacterized protein n=1 Tax=Oryza nivara TaxID=4536 RepID=A0A0E0FLK6_ORYNI